MCEFCEEKEYFKIKGFDVNIEENFLYVGRAIQNIEYLYYRTEINYCPMCGKKLLEK